MIGLQGSAMKRSQSPSAPSLEDRDPGTLAEVQWSAAVQWYISQSDYLLGSMNQTDTHFHPDGQDHEKINSMRSRRRHSSSSQLHEGSNPVSNQETTCISQSLEIN